MVNSWWLRTAAIQGAIDIDSPRLLSNAGSEAILAGPMLLQLLLWSVGRRCSNHA